MNRTPSANEQEQKEKTKHRGMRAPCNISHWPCSTNTRHGDWASILLTGMSIQGRPSKGHRSETFAYWKCKLILAQHGHVDLASLGLELDWAVTKTKAM